MWAKHHSDHREEALPPLKVWLEAVGLMRCAIKLDNFGFITLKDLWKMTFEDFHLIGLSDDDTKLLLEKLVTRGPGSGDVAGLDVVAEQRKLVNESWHKIEQRQRTVDKAVDSLKSG